MHRRLVILGAVVAVVALACGGSDTVDDTPDEISPTSIAPAGAPLVAAACEEGTPDCQDTLVGGDEPLFLDDEPRGGLEPSSGSSGLVIGGGLTVEEALNTDVVGPIAVQGFIVADGDHARLCDLLAESLPPQCGGAFVDVADLGVIDPDDLTSAQGVTWSDHPVTILGEIVDGTLVPTPFSN